MNHWLTISIFIIIYLFISIQRFPFIKIDRPAGVFTGVTLLILAQVTTLKESYTFIDWDVITFLMGMMIMVSYLQNSGFFGGAASFIVKSCKSPKSLLAGIIVSSSLLSALFVNDTVCLLITPIIIAALSSLKLNPIPYLAAVALSSNIGSGLTITGNPQNMYIGIRTNIDFITFVGYTAIPVIISLIFCYFIIILIYKKDMAASGLNKETNINQPIDKPLMYKSLGALFFTIILFICKVDYPLAALIGATIVIITARIKPAQVFKKVDWHILLFFAGLFIVMGAFHKLGYMSALITTAETYMKEGSLISLGLFSAITALISNAISNVPAVILMIPLAEHSDKSSVLLALISTFAGNLTLVGSVANLIVAERAESAGIPFKFTEHLKTGIPVTIFSSLITIFWIYLI